MFIAIARANTVTTPNRHTPRPRTGALAPRTRSFAMNAMFSLVGRIGLSLIFLISGWG
jgi:hypothetical protein